MREYGRVRTSFWTDDKMPSASTEAKLLALYLLTGPHSNMIGCYRLPKGYVTADLGWSDETVSKGFSELFRNGFAERDETTGWTFIRHFLRHNTIENPNVGKKAAAMVETVPGSLAFFPRLLNELEPYTERFAKGFIEAQRNRITTVQEQFIERYGKQEPILSLAEPEPILQARAIIPAGRIVTDHVPLGALAWDAKGPPATAADGAHIAWTFHALRELHFGIAPPPFISAQDISIAQGWADRGAGYEPCRELLDERMKRMAERNERPPGSMRFFDKAIGDLCQRAA